MARENVHKSNKMQRYFKFSQVREHVVTLASLEEEGIFLIWYLVCKLQDTDFGHLVNDRTRYPLKSLGGQKNNVICLFETFIQCILYLYLKLPKNVHLVRFQLVKFPENVSFGFLQFSCQEVQISKVNALIKSSYIQKFCCQKFNCQKFSCLKFRYLEFTCLEVQLSKVQLSKIPVIQKIS